MSDQVYEFSYFALWAKGPACAIALTMSGLPWKGNDQGTKADLSGYKEWCGKAKPTLPWNMMPNLEGPGTPGAIGQEMAILNFIGRKVPAMAGETDTDFCTSQQLMCISEDIWSKLAGFGAPTINAAKNEAWQVEKRKSFWAEPKREAHSSTYGVHVYFKQLDEFYDKCGVGNGKFTSTGCTVGECKLFQVLHALVMCKADVMNNYPGLAAFYERFKNEKATQEVMNGGGNYPHEFKTYFQPPTDL